MCGGGGDSGAAPEVDTYRGPPGPGQAIGGVPLGEPNYQKQAEALLSVGQTYGQLASGVAGAFSSMQPRTMAMGLPPAPASAFNGGIGEYLAGRGAQPMYQPTSAMQAVERYEAGYDPRTSALEMLQGYQGTEAQPLSFYTPESMASMGPAPSEPSLFGSEGDAKYRDFLDQQMERDRLLSRGGRG